MAIDGTFYPAHVAISKEWKVHYFSAAMAESPEHRAEDQAFLENMPHVLGAGVMKTLGRLHAAMKLDYWGIDFSIGANGKVLLYEANATMQVQPPDAGEIWAYRRAPVQRITDAIRTLLFQKPFAAINPQAPSLAHILREAKFRQLEDHIKREPDRVDLDIERARLLIEMDRLDEAKQIYLNILLKDPSQFVALNNLGALLNIMGYHKAALKVYRDVVAQNPESPKARVNLAHNLRESCEMEEARAEYETVLQKEPNLAEAHEGLAHVLMYLGDEKAAWEHHKKSARKNTPPTFSPREEKNLTRVIVLASPCGGNSPIVRFLNKKTFHTLNVIPDFYDPSVPLPPHDLILNAIGDADHCGSSLKAAEGILQHATQPVLNLPARIRTTGREDNARLLGNLDGVVTPRIATFSHDVLAGGGALATLDQQGFTFPLLLRRPGFHEGSHFLRVENPADLKQAVSSIPGQNLLAIQYLDARDNDGKIRKYRVMMIDGRLYPLHKAISSEWMIHYFSAEMTESAAHRAEDEAFLEDMPSVLGPRAMRALELIRDTLGLDYAGADFSLGPNGEVFLFEANATMSIPLPEKDARWNYRRRPVQKIHAAVREMILARANPNGAGNTSI
jgi:tetratricopeptide (TPR) repeat protein